MPQKERLIDNVDKQRGNCSHEVQEDKKVWNILSEENRKELRIFGSEKRRKNKF